MKGDKCGCVGVAPNVRTSAKSRAIQASEMINGTPCEALVLWCFGPSGPLGFNIAQHRQTLHSTVDGTRSKALVLRRPKSTGNFCPYTQVFEVTVWKIPNGICEIRQLNRSHARNVMLSIDFKC